MELHRYRRRPGVGAEERRRQRTGEQHRSRDRAVQGHVLGHTGAIGEAGHHEAVRQVGRGVKSGLHQHGEAHLLLIGDRSGVVVERLPVVLVDHEHLVPMCAQPRGGVRHAWTHSKLQVEQRYRGHVSS